MGSIGSAVFPLHVGAHMGGHVHGDMGEATDPWTQLNPDPFLLLLLGGLAVAYGVGWRRLRRRGGRDWATIPRAICFMLGVATLALALVSPLHHVGMHYLLSAHMVQHMLVGDIAPILLCLGMCTPMRFFLIPRPILRRAARPGVRPIMSVIGRPRTAFAAWLLATAAWYVPVLYTAALEHPALHALMWLTIFVAGVGVWSHILAMMPRMEMSHARRAAYAIGLLFAGMVVSEFLFLNDPLYPMYVDQPQRLLGLSPKADQVRASLLMTAEQMITLVMAATLIMWNHVDRVVALRDAEDPGLNVGP